MSVASMLKANFLLGVAGGLEYLKFNKAAANPLRSQEKTLRGILSYARDSVYGKEHDFGYILQAADAQELFRRFDEKVPANEYADLEPYIERHKKGEADVLFPGKPLIYATTSGTTSRPKWIPITQKYFSDVYGKRSRLWLFILIKNRPKIFLGRGFSIVGKTVEGHAPDGTVFGSVSGFAQGNTPGFVRALYTNPPIVYSIKDYTARYYTLMRMGIEHDVTLIVSVNPSTMIELQKNVDIYFEEYCKDIENGTLSKEVNIESEIRAELEPLFKPNPARAEELRRIKAEKGRVVLKDYWPNLQVLTTWKCANTKIYLDDVADILPEQTFWHEFSYYSSECAVGMVPDGGIDTCVSSHHHYIEFVEESEVGKPDARFYRVHELEMGKRYCPYVTTFSGLYRYNMNDIVEVGSIYKGTPCFHLIGKAGGVVSLTGEKLSEAQFIDAVKTACGKTGIQSPFHIGFLDVKAKGYKFYYEFAQPVTPAQVETFNMAVDAALKDLNIEYASKRDSLRLDAPEPFVLQKDAFEKFKGIMMAEEGSRDGQFKLNLLLQDEMRHSKFKRLLK